jgi:hypothetical protein
MTKATQAARRNSVMAIAQLTCQGERDIAEHQGSIC